MIEDKRMLRACHNRLLKYAILHFVDDRCDKGDVDALVIFR